MPMQCTEGSSNNVGLDANGEGYNKSQHAHLASGGFVSAEISFDHDWQMHDRTESAVAYGYCAARQVEA